ncbi:MAG TPA: arsenite methyltransferase [Dermatophilaceae bacterium]|nr:arsenite methyltransferase [Dermatophilaceae bacterium]
MQPPGSELREQVRRHYAEAAVAVTSAPGPPVALDVAPADPDADPCGGGDCCGGEARVVTLDERFGPARYAVPDRQALPVAAVAASLGCGDPAAVAELAPGERVLDLGSGGGIDVLLSARRVGPTGFVHGVDMTEEMLELARANAAKAGVDNVEFLAGTIEDLPLPDEAVDVVISNCVVNLSTDKPAVLAEMFRVLAPGGRIGVSDVVSQDELSPADRAERGSFVGCFAGALSRAEYVEGLTAAGFTDVCVEFTSEVAPGMHSAVVRARKPAR